EIGEVAQGAGGPALDLRDELGAAGGGEQAEFVLGGVGAQVLEGDVADAAGRLVDDTLEGDVVAGGDEQAEVGEDVAVLLALEEGQALDGLVGGALLEAGGLEGAGQGVHADEDGEVAVLAIAVADGLADASGDVVGLGRSRGVDEDGDLLSGGVVGEEVLGLALDVVGDEGAGGGEDGPG